MNRTAGKAIAIFLLLMLFFTFASHHLDALRTPGAVRDARPRRHQRGAL